MLAASAVLGSAIDGPDVGWAAINCPKHTLACGEEYVHGPHPMVIFSELLMFFIIWRAVCPMNAALRYGYTTARQTLWGRCSKAVCSEGLRGLDERRLPLI
jgi:hypothetical protein